MARHLVIDEIGSDGVNGQIIAKVHIEDDADRVNGRGVAEIYSISPAEIVASFNGDVQQWLTTRVASEMIVKHENRTAVLVIAHGLKGKKLKLDDGPKPKPNPHGPPGPK